MPRARKDVSVARAGLDLALKPGPTFDVVVGELRSALARSGIRLEPGKTGRIVAGEVEVGRVTAWRRGARIALEWRAAPWDPGAVTAVTLSFAAAGHGTRVTLEARGLGNLVGGAAEFGGWASGQVLARFLAALTPGPLGDWITDRRARRPSGAQARATYRDPLYHYPGFRAILAELALRTDDRLLDVGCGGGAFLKLALASGCHAAAIDHSLEMVEVARREHEPAIRAGRLEIVAGSADALPWADGAFTCASMHGVLGFLPDAARVLAEIRRVLAPGGRFVGLGSDPELKGTPAAPEPIASRLHCYDNAELEALARRAGFDAARVIRPDVEPYARAAGIPAAHLALFRSGPDGGNRILVALKR